MCGFSGYFFKNSNVRSKDAWFDAASQGRLLEDDQFISMFGHCQDLKIVCEEEGAWRQGFINAAQFKKISKPLASNGCMLNLLDGICQ